MNLNDHLFGFFHNSFQASVTIPMIIDDVNDNPPQFVQLPYRISLPEVCCLLALLHRFLLHLVCFHILSLPTSFSPPPTYASPRKLTLLLIIFLLLLLLDLLPCSSCIMQTKRPH